MRRVAMLSQSSAAPLSFQHHEVVPLTVCTSASCRVEEALGGNGQTQDDARRLLDHEHGDDVSLAPS